MGGDTSKLTFISPEKIFLRAPFGDEEVVKGRANEWGLYGKLDLVFAFRLVSSFGSEEDKWFDSMT